MNLMLLNSCLLFLSYVFFYINFILLPSNATTTTSFTFTNETDMQALLAIKAQIVEDPYKVFDSWNNSIHFCNWQGVKCNRQNQRVTVLNLSSRNLVGSLSSQIGNLTFLKSIQLENNSLGGTIPPELGHLFRLQNLSLFRNSFRGEIPTNLSRCLGLRLINIEKNNLGGTIPKELGSLPNILELNLSSNHFTGQIPPSLGNLSSLRLLRINYNSLEGNIPSELGQLSKLEIFQLFSNNLSGMVPSSLYNISSITYVALSINQLHGILPPDLGLTLPRLQVFYFSTNKLSGQIPPSIANASELLSLDIGWNSFVGRVPNLGNLQNLNVLNLVKNQLGTKKPNDLDFFDSLTNCTNLQVIYLAANRFGGILPDSTQNLSTKLTILRLDENYISGSIPQDIGNLINLNNLVLNQNMLTGSIPKSIGKLPQLQGLYLYDNNVSGEIPSSVGNNSQLLILALAANMLGGSIPIELGNCTNLQALDLQHNFLTGVIPEQVIGLSSLSSALYLDQNHLTGSLPLQVGNLINLGQLDVSGNRLTGEIPSTLGNCLVLEFLYMEDNLFEGTIPSSLEQLKGLQLLDLSGNNLSGQIPGFLGDLSSIHTLNLSYNRFDGEVPSNGVFRNISAFSVEGNEMLCGGVQALKLPQCRKVPNKAKNHFPRRLIPLIIVIPIVVLLACVALISYRLQKPKQLNSSSSLLQNQYPKISYAELVQATSGFSSTNLIGEGSYGSVYKGILGSDEQIVAVKVLKLRQRGAERSFLAECETLRNIRHRNLVKIITSCSSIDSKGGDFKALVFAFMPNGSLDSWLHPTKEQNRKRLNLIQRLNIAIDVASALEYLHHRCGTTITHCDLKPSNVLLDNELCAHVSDFGLARILLATTGQFNHSQTSSIGIKGTIGYVAPEYGMGGEISTQGDVYSYGILLLEMFIGKRPTDSLFTDNFSLYNHVKMNHPDQVMEIVDPSIIMKEEDKSITCQKDYKSRVCLASILQVGLMCSAQLPNVRMDIRDALMELHVTRSTFVQEDPEKHLKLNSTPSILEESTLFE